MQPTQTYESVFLVAADTLCDYVTLNFDLLTLDCGYKGHAMWSTLHEIR